MADLLRNPDVSLEEKLGSASAFAEEASGITWTNRETGTPDFKISENFHQLTLLLANPETTDAEREEILAFIVEFVNR